MTSTDTSQINMRRSGKIGANISLSRGFDQQMANKIGEYMEEHGVNMVRECVPTSIERVEEGSPGKVWHNILGARIC